MSTVLHNNRIFTEIPKGKGFYFICEETTEILSLMRPNSPKVLKPTVNGNGYLMVGFFTGKNRLNVNVHRALMETFVPNPDNLPHINHKDGNKLNNQLSNLEWCTSQHNTIHAHATGLATSDHCEKEIHQYYLNGSYKASYKSLHEAARATGGAASNIHHCTTGKIKTSLGSLWSYEKHSAIAPYTGPALTAYYLVNNHKLRTIKELSKYTGISETTLYERFRTHGASFSENGFTITKIVFK